MRIVNKNKGAGTIEVVIGLAVVLTGVFYLMQIYDFYFRFALSHKNDVQATLLAEEGIEVVKWLRDKSFSGQISTLNVDTEYGLGFVGQSFESTTSRKYIDGIFDRTFVISDVYRGPTDDISDSGSFDPNTKKVAVNVSYRSAMGTTTKSISTYITNLFGN